MLNGAQGIQHSTFNVQHSPPPVPPLTQSRRHGEDSRHQPTMSAPVPAVEQTVYDVFLSYSRHDLAVVTEIANELKKKGLKVWFDKWILRPGDKWHQQLTSGILASRTVAVFLGPEGPGKWELPEMEAAFNRSV